MLWNRVAHWFRKFGAKYRSNSSDLPLSQSAYGAALNREVEPSFSIQGPKDSNSVADVVSVAGKGTQKAVVTPHSGGSWMGRGDWISQSPKSYRWISQSPTLAGALTWYANYIPLLQNIFWSSGKMSDRWRQQEWISNVYDGYGNWLGYRVVENPRPEICTIKTISRIGNTVSFETICLPSEDHFMTSISRTGESTEWSRFFQIVDHHVVSETVSNKNAGIVGSQIWTCEGQVSKWQNPWQNICQNGDWHIEVQDEEHSTIGSTCSYRAPHHVLIATRMWRPKSLTVEHFRLLPAEASGSRETQLRFHNLFKFVDGEENYGRDFSSELSQGNIIHGSEWSLGWHLAQSYSTATWAPAKVVGLRRGRRGW